MTKKQIEISAKDISAIEKPANQARLVKAPEHFISQELIADINTNGLDEKRRSFLRKGFMSALGGVSAGLVSPIAMQQGRVIQLFWKNKNGKQHLARMWQPCHMVCHLFMNPI